MNVNEQLLITEAVNALQIRDIVLYECRLKRPALPPPDQEMLQVKQATKRGVRYLLGDVPDGNGTNTKRLQVIVELGIRVMNTQAEPSVYFEIEADFLVDYVMKSTISEAAIKMFADHNSVHNVWPFWRQHVFDVVSRGRLPNLQVPLFSGLPG